jgi:polyisoprenoid-binding protein YceI
MVAPIIKTMSNIVTQLPLKAGEWTLDKMHTQVGFAIRHLGVAKVRGRFADVDASLVVGPSLEHCQVSATIATASLDTGNPDRDAHVKSPDLLHVEQRPTMSFRSTGVRDNADGWLLDGELTIGEVTRPITLDVEFGGVADFFDGTRHAGFEATGELRRKDFGLGFGPLGIALGDVVKLELDLEFIEPN